MPFDLDELVLGPCLAAFGEAVQGQALPLYTPAGGVAFGLDGVFDRAWREIDQLSGLPVSSAMPVLGVRLAAVPDGVALAQGDGVVIRGVFYIVREVRPDGHGHALMLLNAA